MPCAQAWQYLVGALVSSINHVPRRCGLYDAALCTPLSMPCDMMVSYQPTVTLAWWQEPCNVTHFTTIEDRPTVTERKEYTLVPLPAGVTP